LNHASFNDSKSSPRRNSWELKAGAESAVADRTTVGANLIGQTPSYVNRSQMSFGNISEYGLQALIGYRAGRATRLGASLSYLVGEEKEEISGVTTKIESDQLSFRLEASAPL
jgi:hypothetical protein